MTTLVFRYLYFLLKIEYCSECCVFVWEKQRYQTEQFYNLHLLKTNNVNIKTIFQTVFFLFLISNGIAQVAVGNGSYTTTFPGSDSAGRNNFPSGEPQVSGNAVNKPIPTNDWWSKLVKENHADNLFNYPMTLKTTNTGLTVTYIPWGPIGDSSPIEIGLEGLSTDKTTVSDFSDWTVTMNWNDGTHQLEATTGIGMPFVYFTKDASSNLQLNIKSGNVSISNEMITVENAANSGDFVIYAPTGSTWSKSGTVYSSTLNDKNYWSIAMLPQSGINISTVANEYKKYAYVFPENTVTDWIFNESTSKVTTTFTVTTAIKEGNNSNVLLGLLPHQWANLAPSSATPTGYDYQGVRGTIKTLEANSFIVENTFKGILPTMPNLGHNSSSFKPQELYKKISSIENDGLATWTDSYNEGQVMNRLIQTARIADQRGNSVARDKMIATVKERLEDWLTYQSGEVAFLFYYNNSWSTLLGYPAGHGQDSNVNDHHFHWGYFIHAAAFLEQFEPGWANEYGAMINLLVRDAASPDRNDNQFPFLRNFSPYAGHSWANGFASFPQGNDQESTSESMQFASSLIHWGTITENDEIRDLGIYIYTTEQTAIEEYWFDMSNRNFQANQQYSLVSRVWGNSYDNGTFWTSDIAASYGIELYPMHGGSLYLGQNKDYIQTIWNELKQHTQILNPNDNNPNLWHDTIWKYLSFLDPEEALDLYDQNADRTLKFGISDAQTYHWLHTMKSLGTLEASVTANYPIAAVFNNNGTKTYVAHNYADTQKTVTFSDGYELLVPANQMITSRDANISAILAADKTEINKDELVNLTATVSGNGITKVAFYNEDNLLQEIQTAPYTFSTVNLDYGIHNLYAKVFKGTDYVYSNIITIQVGEQKPYNDINNAIPGTIEAAHYDYFEGGVGQNITYFDASVVNEGDFRTNEYVDALTVTNEGNTVGWISAGEWLEYTIDVQNTGCYAVDMRYASGNSNGGGPIYFEINGQKVSENIGFSATGGWNNWTTKTVNMNLTQGIHILRMMVDQGEFNIGRMEFTFSGSACAVPQILDLPFDFETFPTTADFNNFDGATATVAPITTPQSNGNSTTNMAKIVRDGGQSWAGAYINLNNNLDFTNNKYISLNVWTEAPIGTSVQIKLEQQSGSSTFGLETTTKTTGAWETLYWDFSQLGASNYNKLVFMFDIGNVGDGSNTSTFYFDDVQQTATLSTKENLLSQFKIFPNPTKDLLYVVSTSYKLTKIEIYNVVGKKLKSFSKNLDKININDLSHGMYLLKIYTENNSVMTKILKN